ncbi:MAG: anaerobic sulfatase maturase [Planctomycetota bacterium]|nr:anaerobic sulfatase maturase [Planctomycetota bacterium]
MPEIVRPFNIMAKPVCGMCNLDCDYCYYTSKPEDLYHGVGKFLMDDDVLDSYIRQYLEAMPVRCQFGWQGGEPTLAGLDFFRKAVDFQDRHKKQSQTVTNALQTNGTLLTDEWCEFLAEKKFLVGVSIDGPPQWHDKFRRDRAGGPTFHRAWAGLELMRKHGVEFNVLVTLNSANAPHGGDVYRYFVNRGVRYLQFIPILERLADGGPAPFACSGRQFGRFMLDVFDLWGDRDVGKVSERFIDSVMHTIIYGNASLCCYSPRCADAHVLEFNGDLYACDHFVFKEWRIGNIMKKPLADLVRDPKLEEFARLKTDLPTACQHCEFLRYCHGGCPKHHVPIGIDPARVNHFCEGYKMFFSNALGELKRIAEYIKQGRQPQPKESQPPAPNTPATPSAKVKPPGRNDPCPCGSGRKFKRCCGRRA